MFLVGVDTTIICCFLHAVNVGEDCPVFDGMFEFCQISAGGSIGEWLIQCEGGSSLPTALCDCLPPALNHVPQCCRVHLYLCMCV